MAVRDFKTRSLAIESGVPYGTLRRILELNTVADYEQLRKIAEALRMPLSSIIADAEHLTKDAGVIEDYQATDNRETSSDHENIDIDAWADRIKAEDSIHNKAFRCLVWVSGSGGGGAGRVVWGYGYHVVVHRRPATA